MKGLLPVRQPYIDKGFDNVKCLAGGVEAWKKAGYSLVEEE